MVSKLVYPNCTQDKILPKVMTRYNFLKQDYVATIGYTVCNQFIFVFAYVYPILHNIRQTQAADTECLSPPHFSENHLTSLRNQTPSTFADYDTVVAFAVVALVFVAG